MHPTIRLVFNLFAELVLAVVSTRLFAAGKPNVVLVPGTALTTARKDNLS